MHILRNWAPSRNLRRKLESLRTILNQWQSLLVTDRSFNTKHLHSHKNQLNQNVIQFPLRSHHRCHISRSLLIFTPLSIFSIFTASTTNLMINVGRFFLLSGIALFLLDIPSILKIIGLSQETTQSKGNLGYKMLFFAATCNDFYIVLYVLRRHRIHRSVPGGKCVSKTSFLPSPYYLQV